MNEELLIELNKLWNSNQEPLWKIALSMYFGVSSAERNCHLERQMDNTKELRNRFKNMDSKELYDFFINEFIVWKYTTPNRKATVTKHFMKKHSETSSELEKIRNEIMNISQTDILYSKKLLVETTKLGGIGTAGGSGLLSLLFPEQYGTVDQFVVKTLVEISDNTPELPRDDLLKIHPSDITIKQAVLLEEVLREKAKSLNDLFRTNSWTPRKIDKILWSFGRTTCSNIHRR